MPTKPKLTWEKSAGELVALFERVLPKGEAVVQKKMFGWPCGFVNGNLFAGLHKQSMIFRLSASDHAEFLKLDGAAEFEPMPGRKMKGYGILGDPLSRDPREIERWMKRSLEFTRTLPGKAKAPGPAKIRKKAGT